MDLTERMFENLDGDTVAAVMCYVKDLGTDSPKWAMEAISIFSDAAASSFARLIVAGEAAIHLHCCRSGPLGSDENGLDLIRSFAALTSAWQNLARVLWAFDVAFASMAFYFKVG